MMHEYSDAGSLAVHLKWWLELGELGYISPEYIDIDKTFEYNLKINGSDFMKSHIAARLEKMKKEKVIAALRAFESGLEFSGDNWEANRNYTGHINETWEVLHKPSGKKFIVQRLNAIFDIEAIDRNIQLLEEAQLLRR